MVLEKTKFQRYKDEAEYKKADIVSVRLNYEERLFLDALKEHFNTDSDSTALKTSAFTPFVSYIAEKLLTKK